MLNNLLVSIYLISLLSTIAFQLGLLFGKPWGEWTMGGYIKGVLPYKNRLAPLFSVIILIIFIAYTIQDTQIFTIQFGIPSFLGWLIVGFNFLAVIANSVTRSSKERRLWQPITIIMLLCSLYLFI